MSFWSGEKLEAELPRLIEPFVSTQIDCAAYTLRIGCEVYISPSNAAEASTRTKIMLGEKQSFVIPPGQFAFLLTEERVEVPHSAIAFISMKAKIKFKGLVNVSGFHVDPGYNGRLIFAVFNAGPAAVHLSRGENCFLIWYASLDRESIKPYVKAGSAFNGISSDVINPIAGELQSLAGLSSRIDKVEREHQILRLILATAVTLGIALLARSCQPQVGPRDTTPSVVAPNNAPPVSGAPLVSPPPTNLPVANPRVASPPEANPTPRSGPVSSPRPPR